MEGFQWYLQSGGETLLLVAVSAEADKPGAWPCRVVGSFTPGALPHPPADDISILVTYIWKKKHTY